jgi:hypothetical protein
LFGRFECAAEKVSRPYDRVGYLAACEILVDEAGSFDDGFHFVDYGSAGEAFYGFGNIVG